MNLYKDHLWREHFRVTSIQGFVSKEPRGERLENNFARLFGRHLSLHAMRLAAVFVGTSLINHLAR